MQLTPNEIRRFAARVRDLDGLVLQRTRNAIAHAELRNVTCLGCGDVTAFPASLGWKLVSSGDTWAVRRDEVVKVTHHELASSGIPQLAAESLHKPRDRAVNASQVCLLFRHGARLLARAEPSAVHSGGRIVRLGCQAHRQLRTRVGKSAAVYPTAGRGFHPTTNAGIL